MRFPQSAAEVPSVVIDYLAKQVKVRTDQFQTYKWLGRTIEYHRAQIRALHGFRETSVEDADALSQWLQEHALQQERNHEHLKVAVYQRCRELKIEPPTPERVERLVRSPMRNHEEAFNAETLSLLSPEHQTSLEALLHPALIELEKQSKAGEGMPESQRAIWQTLKADPGRASTETMFEEIAKLEKLRSLKLPPALFAKAPRKILQGYRQRAAVEELTNFGVTGLRSDILCWRPSVFYGRKKSVTRWLMCCWRLCIGLVSEQNAGWKRSCLKTSER
jgi:hypothetical protein